jgi:hypothetical protein
MPRPATGSIRAAKLSDGTAVYRLRFQVAGVRELVVLHERPNCGCGCGGGWDAAAARTELGNIQARIRAGVWKRPEPPPTLVTPEGGGERVPTFHEYASWWLQAKINGVLGKKPLSASTATDYRWRLRCHLLPFFAKYRLDQIDRDLCLAFKAQKLREAKELRDALGAGADMRHRLGRRAVPLSPASMRKLLDCLAGILDEQSRTAISRATRRPAVACESTCPSRHAPSWRWTSWPRSSTRRGIKTCSWDRLSRSLRP